MLKGKGKDVRHANLFIKAMAVERAELETDRGEAFFDPKWYKEGMEDMLVSVWEQPERFGLKLIVDKKK